MEVIFIKDYQQNKIGDLVTVKDGYGRNYLLPQGIALRATSANREYFEAKRAEYQAINDKILESAHAMREQLGDASVLIIRDASHDMKLYGSISQHDLALAIKEKYGLEIETAKIVIHHKIKHLGQFKDVEIRLHRDLIVPLEVIVEAPAGH